MRVVAGTVRGRRLVAPEGGSVRPTTDRVREAVFNALESFEAVRDRRVLDLFAGSGALAIEALSRGAAHATLVECDRRALAAVATNLAATGLADRATVVRAEAERYLRDDPAVADLVLLDPPYSWDRWPAVLAALAPARGPRALAPGGLVVVETDREPVLPDGWGVVRSKRYGSTLVVFARPD